MKAEKFSQYIQSRETLRHVDKPHWIYVVSAIVWAAIIVLGCLAISQYALQNLIYSFSDDGGFDEFFRMILYYFNILVVWGSTLCGILYVIYNIMYVSSTYIFATDRRLYIKTGVILVKVSEINFEEIHQTDIGYGFFGRFIGYGRLLLDARFVDDASVPYCSTPEKFSQLIHYENDLTKDINLSYVTGDGSQTVNEIIPPEHCTEGQIKPMYEQVDSDKPLRKPRYDDISNTPRLPDNKKATSDHVKEIDEHYEHDFSDAADENFQKKYEKINHKG